MRRWILILLILVMAALSGCSYILIEDSEPVEIGAIRQEIPFL